MSVRKRGAGQWEVRWWEGDRHRSRTFTDEIAAKEHDLAVAKRKRLGAFAPLEPSATPLVEYARAWVDREQHGWAKSTRLNRAHHLDRWIVPYLGQRPLREIGSVVVRDWRASIEKAGASPVTSNRTLGTLSAMLGNAARDGLLPYNPCAGVTKRRELASRPWAPAPIEVERLRMAMLQPRDALLVSLMAYAGLRPAEAFALTWADVGNLLVIDRSFSYGELKATKTGTRRTVDIVQPLRDDLEAAQRTDWPLVCPNRRGQPLDLRTWRRRIWKPAAQRAGVHATPYDLRHTYCSLLAHESRSMPYIAAMMGHSITDTQRHYAHIIDDAKLEPGKPMPDAIKEARSDVRKLYAPAQRRHLKAVG